jgi:hypothetical protein
MPFGKRAAVDVPQAGMRNHLPLLEDVAVEGITRRSQGRLLLRTLEDRLRCEKDYNWFRYSKTAQPCLLFIGLIALTLLCLTFWTGNFNIKGMRDGVPRYVEFPSDSDDAETGLDKHQRNVRLASSGLAIFGVAFLYALFVCKPTPFLGRIGNLLTCIFVLFPALVMCWVGFGMDVGNMSDVFYCPRTNLGSIYTANNGSPLNRANQGFNAVADPTLTQPCEGKGSMIITTVVIEALLAIFIMVLIVLVLYFTFTGDWLRKRNPKNWRQRENDAERDRPLFKQKKAAKADGEFAPIAFNKKTKTRKVITAVFLATTFVLAVMLLTFTLVIFEYRGPLVSEAQSLNKAPLSEPEYGWSVRNIRLRLACAITTLLLIGFNLIPFRSRIIHQFFALAYFALACLSCAALAYDLRELLDVGKRDCPVGFECKSAMFGGIVGIDFLLFLWLLGYVLWEFVSRIFVRCKYCSRDFTFAEVGKHSKYRCGARPIICEICGQEFSASEFVYKHRMVCGTSHTRCDKCGVFVPEWGIKGHQDECPRWPLKCSMCGMTFYRADMPAHVVQCPNKPVSCNKCGETFKQSDMEEHRKRCPEMIVECPLCGPRVKMQRRLIERHLQQECPHRLVHCELCDVQIPVYKLERHQKSECPQRLVTCNQCGAVVPFSERQAHALVCPYAGQ